MNAARVAELQARHKANGRLSDQETEELLRWAVRTADWVVSTIHPKEGDLYLIRTNDVDVFNDLAASGGNPFAPARVLVVRSDLDLATLTETELATMGLQRIATWEGADAETPSG